MHGYILSANSNAQKVLEISFYSLNRYFICVIKQGKITSTFFCFFFSPSDQLGCRHELYIVPFSSHVVSLKIRGCAPAEQGCTYGVLVVLYRIQMCIVVSVSSATTVFLKILFIFYEWS